MSKLNPIYRGIMCCALAIPATALAQGGGQLLEEIVVTGSLIRGIPEDAAMPVDTIQADELEKQGSPPPLEMLKSLSYMAGIVGESNNFASGRGQAAHGTASINLRGLGSNRTLVLLNGKRLAASDANRLPQNAIARVEVLKDGGAVTYGSDAIAGVVNYITKENQDGFEFSADYRAIDDSDGDYNIGLTWGTSTDRSDFFTAFNYYHRSELKVSDRGWAVQPYAKNPQGGWSSGSMPGSIGYPGSVVEVDPGCKDFGGVITQGGRDNPTDYWLDDSGKQCRTQYTPWYNLVDEQDTYQAFASYNLALTDNMDLKLEALYAKTEVDHASAAPSYTTANYVPMELGTGVDVGFGAMNPFYRIAGNPYVGTASSLTLNQWRPYFTAGNPAFGGKGAWTNYDREQARFSAELSGMFSNDIGYRTSLTYSKSEDTRQEWDIRIDKLQAALRGFGGPDCGWSSYQDWSGLTPGQNGCLYMNPLSSAYPTLPNGQPNPRYNMTDQQLAEQAAIARWLMEQHTSTAENELIEFNFVLDGELGVELAGGNIGWAAGLQYRHETVANDYSDLSNQLVNPCPIYGDTSCSEDLRGASPWTFLATYVPYDLDREVKAVFGELMIPVTDNFTAQLAARFEDYGNAGGDSFDPSIRLRWQATDWMAFRASAGTTFRVASQTALRDAVSTGFSSVKGNSTPIRVRGNPKLKPEESTNYNLGVMFTGDNYTLTIDYWRFELDNILTSEPLTGIVEAYHPTGKAANCSLPQAFLDRFDFGGDGTCGQPIVGMNLNTINAGKITTDGIDIAGSYDWDNVGPGSLTLGGSATWINQYKGDALVLDGVTVQEAYDGVGKLNSGTTLTSLPEWRGNIYLNYAMYNQNIRWTVNYISSYKDNRDIFEGIYTAGRTIDSHITHNLTYRYDLNENVTLSAVLDNVFDEEPPFARLEMNYDPVTHSPLTRTLKVGAKVRF